MDINNEDLDQEVLQEVGPSFIEDCDDETSQYRDIEEDMEVANGKFRKKRNRIKYTITPNKNVAHTTEEQRPITDHGKL